MATATPVTEVAPDPLVRRVGRTEIDALMPACVAMFTMRDLGISHDKVNVHGGATALGHPIGASGARIMATLISALQTYGKTKGVAALCIGGGEATAVAIELV
jgi:acetyl-CoA C-acetyltransferase